jgi:hypothetical protein
MAKNLIHPKPDFVSFSFDAGGSRRDTVTAMRQAICPICAGIGRRRGRGLNARH